MIQTPVDGGADLDGPVLLVEDDREVRESIAEILEEEHVPVLTAAHGEAALELLRHCSRPPSLILLDLMRPVMDGWQFREEQARDPALARIPVVVISATANHERPLEGASAFLKKPINLEHLLEVVRKYGLHPG
jgi:CheY-like chemotaxis protein